MSTETSIEIGDKVTDDILVKERLFMVLGVSEDFLLVVDVDSVLTPASWRDRRGFRLVAKASYTEVPEPEPDPDEHWNAQLRELAALNGTTVESARRLALTYGLRALHEEDDALNPPTPVPEPPSEHPAVTELREVWQEWYVDPIEYSCDNYTRGFARLARAVLAVIDLIPKPDPCGEQSLAGWYEAMEDENRANAAEAAWRSATEVEPPEDPVVATLRSMRDSECSPWPRSVLTDALNGLTRLRRETHRGAELQAEVTRLRAELDAERARSDAAGCRSRDLRAGNEYLVDRAVEHDAEITRLTARAEAAEAASSRLVEAMEKLADELAEHGQSDVFATSAQSAYGYASARIRAAAKEATEGRLTGGESNG